MFKYDTVHGNFKGDIHTANGKLVINGQEIAVFAEKVQITSKSDGALSDILNALRTLQTSRGASPALTTSSSPLVSSPRRRRLVST